MNLCDYGCGKEAKHQFKNGKLCCQDKFYKCPSYKSNLSKKLKGKPKSEDHKRKLSDSHKGKKHSEETKQVLKELNIGENNAFYGKHHTEETRKLLSKLNSGENNPNFGKKRNIHSKRMKGKRNPSWKGGYHSNNIPTYNFFYDKLTVEEQPERDILDPNILTVQCSRCKKRYIPKLESVYERVRALNGKQYGEQRLYCSQECKNECSIYKKHIYQEDHPKIIEKYYTEDELQTFRDEVFKRANNLCEYCGDLAKHVHHIKPQKIEPFFTLDPNYGISCCEKCHYEKGHKDECSTGMLASKVCK